MEYLLPLALYVAAFAIGASWWFFRYQTPPTKQDAADAQRRVKDQQSLADARRRYAIAAHELTLDSHALKIAAMELFNVKDADGKCPYGDDWQHVARGLRTMAHDFDAAMDDQEVRVKIRGQS